MLRRVPVLVQREQQESPQEPRPPIPGDLPRRQVPVLPPLADQDQASVDVNIGPIHRAM